MKSILAFGVGVMVGCCYKSCKQKMCKMKGKNHCNKDQASQNENT